MAATNPDSLSPATESECDDTFGIPADVLTWLPSDPYEQLDMARKITSVALASRINRLDDEADELRARLEYKEDVVAGLRTRVQALDETLAGVAQQLARAREEKEALLEENVKLSSTVNRLSRDVSKLETFKKTLMQSLQGEDGSSPVAKARVAPRVSESSSFSTESPSEVSDDRRGLLSIKPSPHSQTSEARSVVTEDSHYGGIYGFRHGRPYSLLASYTSTPRLTPPDSPPRFSAPGTPKRSSKPVSPKRHSISFSAASRHSSINSSHGATTQAGRTRVDGKEFFGQVRSRLSYEQFSAFLVNVKELNARKQTKEETLQKADKIFGLENKDLFNIFESLISRNLQ